MSGEVSQPLHPEVEAALTAYNNAICDGTERDQKRTFEELQAAQRRLGGKLSRLPAKRPKLSLKPSTTSSEWLASKKLKIVIKYIAVLPSNSVP